MDFSAIDIDQITQRAGGTVVSVFAISMIDKQLATMNATTKDASGKDIAQENVVFKYRHYGYAFIGVILPYLVAPTKNKEDFSTKYQPAIRAFSDAMLFYGASQVLENNLPQYVNIAGVGQNFATYVMGADTGYAMNNYVQGTSEQMMLVERATGQQVFIDPNTGQYVKRVLEQPAPPRNPYDDASDFIKTGSPQDQFTMRCNVVN